MTAPVGFVLGFLAGMMLGLIWTTWRYGRYLKRKIELDREWHG